MKRKSSAVFLLLASVYAVFVVRAGEKPDDVSTGIEMEEALIVAKKCVLQASTFNDPRTLKIKELRPEDTLAFAGVSDEFRLNALRRFIVRNRQIGVQSIWGDPFGNGIQPYIISRFALSKISKDWTVAKLALEIAKSAGLPRLPVEKVKSLITECRQTAGKKSTVQLGANIRADLADRFGAFKECMLPEVLVDSVRLYSLNAGVTDPEGESYNYRVRKTNAVENVLDTGSYFELIQMLQREAEIEFSPTLTAITIVVGAFQPLHPNLRENCLVGSFPLSNLCGAVPIDESSTIESLGLSAAAVKAQIVQNLKRYQPSKGRSVKTSAVLADFPVDEKTPLWEMIDEVEKKLSGGVTL